MATKKQIRANRSNSLKGGVKTPEGKAVSRLNARSHGIFASALTRYDRTQARQIYRELAAWIQPVGPVEGMLVEKLAHTYLRLQRCARAEAEFHITTWEPKLDSLSVRNFVERRESGLHASNFSPRDFTASVNLFARYDTALTNQLIKLLHEIERLQRMRLGDQVPLPIAADLTVQADTASEDEERDIEPELVEDQTEAAAPPEAAIETLPPAPILRRAGIQTGQN